MIFDLDGTLIDSSQDLCLSVNATRQFVGLSPLDPDLIQGYVGNGAPALIRRALGEQASEELHAEALTYFLQYYRAHSLEHTKLYPGIRDSILKLASDGHYLAVLTNKPVKISADILQALQLDQHFQRVYGGDSFPNKKPDPQGILALQIEKDFFASETIMIGDSGVDIQTAKNAGVRSCGVMWGFQPEAFQQVKPDFVVARPSELADLPELVNPT